jgi:hypothetical protein
MSMNCSGMAWHASSSGSKGLPALARALSTTVKCLASSMPSKAPRRPRKLKRIPKGHRIDVRRDEFDRLIDLLNERGEVVNRILRAQEIQFERIAQMQVEIDRLRRLLTDRS